jgi:DNA-binding response OmpR family regulator
VTVGLAATASYLPERWMTAAEIADASGIPEEVIVEKFGLRGKHIASPDEHVSDLAVSAGRRLLDEQGLDPKQIDAVVYFGSTWKDYAVWQASPWIAHRLGCANAQAIEYDNVSCGTPVALRLCRNFLLAEPELRMQRVLERHLHADGFDVVRAGDEAEVLELVERRRPDLVLTSLELCRKLREGVPGRSWNREVPVIVLAQGEADAIDTVRAFERGCDDYVTAPFHYEELVARIRAVLRRTAPRERERLEVGELVIDRATRRVAVGSRPVHLSAKEYDLLLKLAGDPTRVFTKEQLLREVWGFRSLGRTRTLDSHASRLRRKLSAVAAGPFVLNVWGVGYRLLAD